MVRWPLFVVTAFWLSRVGPIQAQGGGELPSALQPATRTAIISLGDSMAREGLPVRPLYDKAAEGHLKGADDARILAAVRSLAARLRQARQAIGPSGREADLVAGASALFAGISPDVVRRVVAVHQQRNPAPPLALSLTVLTDLVSKQVPTDVAVASVETLLTRGARDIDLSEMLRAVEQDIRVGRVPGEAVRERTQGILRTIERRRPN